MAEFQAQTSGPVSTLSSLLLLFPGPGHQQQGWQPVPRLAGVAQWGCKLWEAKLGAQEEAGRGQPRQLQGLGLWDEEAKGDGRQDS